MSVALLVLGPVALCLAIAFYQLYRVTSYRKGLSSLDKDLWDRGWLPLAFCQKEKWLVSDTYYVGIPDNSLVPEVFRYRSGSFYRVTQPDVRVTVTHLCRPSQVKFWKLP